ncbi:MAG: ABC-type transport auxiliary lipoprotein family protein [Fibromonadaceae bacterium]|jgi:uncharacterized lipoprotein YmbA|nr:ABC-type transport auxiliary lipoprotein family protein [Fibromonadaceae bacterium]
MKKLLIIISATVAMLLGCWGRVIESSYYQLDYVPTPKEMLEETSSQYTVRIKDFNVAEAYRRNNIVYRQSPYKLHFYNYDLWAVKLEYMIPDMFFRHLDAAKIFSEVRRGMDMDESDYTISGTIRAIEEYDNQDEWYAHLAMNINLQESRSRRTLWSKEWDYRKKVSNLETIYVVRGLSELLEYIHNEAIADIDSVIRAQVGGVKQAGTYKNVPLTNSVEMETLPPPGEIK